MAKVIVEMDIDFADFKKIDDVDKHGLIRAILESGNDSTNVKIDVKSIQIVTE